MRDQAYSELLCRDESDLEEPTRTLVRHVLALQERIDALMDPDEHDRLHGRDCLCTFVQCACAYDHPDAVCMSHAARRA